MSYNVDDLLRIMERLRDPDTGCPWDLQQDFQSILPSTLEECYELAAAIEQGDFDHVEDELGDVLFQVVFHAQLGREAGLFDFAGVVNNLAQKLIRRHPHVFADAEIEGVARDAGSVESVKVSWEAIKRAERAQKNQAGVLADVPLALPALPRAQKLQRRAAQVNFDWTSLAEAELKLDEELAELRAALDGGQQERIQEELGDLLFTCVNVARHAGVDAEEALRMSSRKFETRFRHMETEAAQRGTPLESLSPSQWDALWGRAKTGSED